MRTSLTTAGRRAGVLAVATALALLTTACVPEELGRSASAPDTATGTTEGVAGHSGSGVTAQAPGSVPTTEAGEQTVVETPPVPVAPDAPGADPAGDRTDPAATEPAATEPAATEQDGTDPADTHPADTDRAVAATGQPLAAAETATGRRGHGTAGRGARSSSVGESAPVAAASPAAAPAVSGGSTGGSGGSYSDQPRASFTAGNGQTGRYLRYAGGIDAGKPVGLVMYVDGTGEYGIDNPNASYALGGSSGLVAHGKARNMVTLAVESPNQSCECWHTGDTAAYADFLAELIEEEGIGKYPISEVWLAGFSSGAQEITRFLVPRHPELMRLGGGWVVFGGGGPPAGGTALTAASMAGVRGHWFTGTADTAVPLTASWGARAGRDWYAGRGVTASSEFPSGVGHALDGRLGPTVGRMLDAG
ncbi:hypothetical protein ABC795_11360 [Blastococcus sp. HT6-30]|uniref:hypothetical protein n=1 Tax=Blastococcus sp. HT6-30 TaxID=3144843 RepID=UPI00321AED1C